MRHTLHRSGDTVALIGGVGLGVSVGLGALSVRPGLSAPGGVMLAAGTLSALAGTYLCLVLLLLVARVPWLEREMGQDRLVALHRRVAPYSLLLIVAHVVCTTVAYAQSAQRGILAEVWTLVAHTRWMLPAAAAFVVMTAVGLMSARVVRRHMSYETWWVAHLYFYLAVALALGHQLVLGPMFAGRLYATVFWSALYVFVAVAILLSRVVLPLWLSLRHGLRVGAVVPEGAGVVSVYIGGRHLDRLDARGGQFFQWRFMTRQWWWQAHPYSLSQSPNGRWLRITVKDLGDQSARLSHLRVGTRVFAEGPYGVFTAQSRHGDSVTAFAAGVGITPIRAVLDDLPSRTAVTVVCRVPDLANAPLRGELETMAEDRGWALHYVTGSREQQPMTTDRIRQLAPAVADSDVYVCGPGSFAADVVHAVRAIGVPKNRIHHEAFEF